MIRFNSGLGGITCDYCAVLVAAGKVEKPKFIYQADSFLDCEDHHFCDDKCLLKYCEREQCGFNRIKEIKAKE